MSGLSISLTFAPAEPGSPSDDTLQSLHRWLWWHLRKRLDELIYNSSQRDEYLDLVTASGEDPTLERFTWGPTGFFYLLKSYGGSEEEMMVTCHHWMKLVIGMDAPLIQKRLASKGLEWTPESLYGLMRDQHPIQPGADGRCACLLCNRIRTNPLRYRAAPAAELEAAERWQQTRGGGASGLAEGLASEVPLVRETAARALGTWAKKQVRDQPGEVFPLLRQGFLSGDARVARILSRFLQPIAKKIKAGSRADVIALYGLALQTPNPLPAPERSLLARDPAALVEPFCAWAPQAPDSNYISDWLNILKPEMDERLAEACFALLNSSNDYIRPVALSFISRNPNKLFRPLMRKLAEGEIQPEQIPMLLGQLNTLSEEGTRRVLHMLKTHPQMDTVFQTQPALSHRALLEACAREATLEDRCLAQLIHENTRRRVHAFCAQGHFLIAGGSEERLLARLGRALSTGSDEVVVWLLEQIDTRRKKHVSSYYQDTFQVRALLQKEHTNGEVLKAALGDRIKDSEAIEAAWRQWAAP